jgi:hypothetical protein
MKSSHLLIFAISCWVLVFISLKINQASPEEYRTAYEETKKVDSLMDNRNDSLRKIIERKNLEIDSMKLKLDSLDSLKPKIIIRYVRKVNEIKNASSVRMFNEFKRILAKDSIK